MIEKKKKKKMMMMIMMIMMNEWINEIDERRRLKIGMTVK